MVSIIVPIYNVEQYISKCIESILAQTYRDFELILVDDGSPDMCGTICDEYARTDSRVYVIHQENKGLSAARNAGISLAKGEYISFIDGDDYVEKDFFERIIRNRRLNPLEVLLSWLVRILHTFQMLVLLFFLLL